MDSGFRVQILERQYLMPNQTNHFACSTNMLDQSAERDGTTLDWPNLSLKSQKVVLFRSYHPNMRLQKLMSNPCTFPQEIVFSANAEILSFLTHSCASKLQLVYWKFLRNASG